MGCHNLREMLTRLECYELIIRRRVARPCLAGHVSAQKRCALPGIILDSRGYGQLPEIIVLGVEIQFI